MSDSPNPAPTKVYRVRVTNSVFGTIFLTFFLGVFLGLSIGSAISVLAGCGNEGIPYFASGIGLTIIFFGIRWLVKANNTKARIEISGNCISLFDKDGQLTLSDDLSQISEIYNSRKITGSNGHYDDYYHVLFKSGNLLTFNQYLENDFTLQKYLKAVVGHSFERLEWSEYQMLELESKSHRAQRVLEMENRIHSSGVPIQ